MITLIGDIAPSNWVGGISSLQSLRPYWSRQKFRQLQLVLFSIGLIPILFKGRRFNAYHWQTNSHFELARGRGPVPRWPGGNGSSLRPLRPGWRPRRLGFWHFA